MAAPQRLIHRYVDNLARVPYRPSQSPVGKDFCWITGQNLVSNPLNGAVERRSGWAAAFESTPTTFPSGSTLQRQFSWRKWGASWYVMLNEITASASKVYKLQVGTDASYVLLFTSSSTNVFDFIVSNNTVYFTNVTDAQKWDGTTLSKWGIAAPTMAPRGGWPGSSTGSWLSGAKFAYAYYNTVTGHLSSPSFSTGSSGATTSAANYTIIAARSADPQVDEIWLFRSVDGGDGVYFYDGKTSNPAITTVGPVVGNAAGGGPIVSNNPTTGGSYSGGTFPNFKVVIDGVGAPNTFKWSDNGGTSYNATGVAITAGAQTLSNAVTITFTVTTGYTLNDQWDFSNRRIGIDSGGDDALLSSVKVSAASTTNDPPLAMYGLVEFANRIWSFNNDQVYFCAFEELVDTGVEEESWPPNNKFGLASEVTGIAKVADGVLVFTGDTVSKISGYSLDTFRMDPLYKRMGCRERSTIVQIGDLVAWLDTNNTVRITDGSMPADKTEIGFDIRADISAITHAQASMCYHFDGKSQFLMLLDGAAAKVRVYNLDTGHWEVPWGIGGRSIASLETAAGTYKLLLGHTTRKVLVNTGLVYTDDGSAYAADMISSNVPISPTEAAGMVSELEYVSVETNATVPTTVSWLPDEDPASGSFTDITANLATPALRTQGTNYKEGWYYARKPPARRAAVKLTYPTNSSNFKAYALDFASLELQK